MSWELLWKIIFIIIMVAFALMAVATTILGAKDVKNLLRDLNRDDESEDGDKDP